MSNQPISHSPEASARQVKTPLFVDLDGTVLATNSLYEAALQSVRNRPLEVLTWPLWLVKGRARLKAELAASGKVNVASLPYDRRMCQFLRDERDSGRKIYLATAADQRIAQQVSDYLGLFDGILASDGVNNLKGGNKLAAIRRLAGEDFAYAGNGREDRPIWAAARSAIVVNAPGWLEAEVQASGKVEQVFPREGSELLRLLAAMRPYQWVKNTLIFIPLITSFQFFTPRAVLDVLVAFVAFCLCASAVYLLNDLLDLDADRAHPRKRARPFAAGQVAIPKGIAVAGLLLLTGLAVAALQSIALCATVGGYVLLSTAYSTHLKHYVILDAVVLAALYTWRLLAGVVAAQVFASAWLLGFALFIFLSLALLKRCAELVSIEGAGGPKASGRDYHVSDLRVLWPLGIAMSLCSVVIFVLYVNAPEVRARYAHPSVLWIVAVALVYWLSRMWLKTSRAEMTDDPIVYALKDFGSRVTLAFMIVATLAAHFAPKA